MQIGPIPTINKLFSIHTREWEHRGRLWLEQVYYCIWIVLTSCGLHLIEIVIRIILHNSWFLLGKFLLCGCFLPSLLTSGICLEESKINLSILGFNQNNVFSYFWVETSGRKFTHVICVFEKYLITFGFLYFVGIINLGAMRPPSSVQI